ncbi:exonuclease subunit SbcD [Thermocrinis sp.]|uniref:metallophosphoesterase family protein n=1 Tax=Thermocrinis sp. TaxID=2024383 RepID=UPI002FDDBBEC
MRKILHISDLHAGKNLNKVSRNPDLSYALEQVSDLCNREKVEAILIAGDIFDKAIPDYESEHMVLDYLTEWAGRDIHVVLIAGNHDSYDKLKAYKNLEKLTKIHIFDRPKPNPSEAIFVYDNLAIACLPYPSERLLTRGSEDTHRAYSYKVADYLKALAKQVENFQYKILLSHLMVEKGIIAGSEREASVSEFYAIRPDQIPEVFDYVALGHLHVHQKIDSAAAETYYSGSLYQIDFSEKDTKKFVNLVILEDNQIKVEPISLPLYRELKEIRIGKDQSIRRILEEIAHENALFKIILEIDQRDPMLNSKVQQINQALGEKLVFFKLDFSEYASTNMQNIESLNILDLYKAYYKQNYNCDLPEELEREVIYLLNMVHNETD